MASNDKSASAVASTSKTETKIKDADGALKLGKKMASVFVGANTTEPYVVHLDLLTATSEFFKKALTGEFKEKNGAVRLAGESPDVFEQYMGWLYNEKLPTSLTFFEQFNIYVFGVFVQDDKFCNAAIDCLIEAVSDRNMAPRGLVGIACLKLPPSSPFIKLLVDFCVYISIFSPIWFDNEAGDNRLNAPTEFWLAVAKGLSILASSKADTNFPWSKDKTQYHIHSEGASKSS
ncbi:hypothetical protein E2P81_ATG00737 [Venturia nashicola]|uniref:BTB domain-containing protein n=1 Tax=Venturia nashicola TaxID=86259 RepID=A0A4Z1PJ65_9PEZI|nr:hypothetical protein E6O75_ATG00754 [Venturia nashicola]TLD39750.1 hypothetical protein E2P81_ATG00737 [Venturia nashicola]